VVLKRYISHQIAFGEKLELKMFGNIRSNHPGRPAHAASFAASSKPSQPASIVLYCTPLNCKRDIFLNT